MERRKQRKQIPHLISSRCLIDVMNAYELAGITDDIPAEVMTVAESSGTSYRNYTSVICEFGGEVVQRIFGFRHKKHSPLEIKEVIRCATNSGEYIARSIYFRYINGWQVDFETPCGWERIIGTHILFQTPVLNADFLSSTRFKYSGYSWECGAIIPYLDKYLSNPAVEYFGKLGLKPSEQLLKMAKKDKQFCRYLIDHADEVRIYGPQATISAYKKNTKISEERIHLAQKASDARNACALMYELKGTKIDRRRALEYAKGFYASYNDYLRAIKNIGLALDDTKNVFPNDFQRMHDVRIAEYESIKAAEDAKQRAALYAKFATVSDSLKNIEYTGGDYLITLPRSPADLVAEGNALHHCVGKMGYDVKMADGRSIICFLRRISAPELPLVTIELNATTGELRQAYGDHDSKPAEDVMAYINKIWLPYAKQKIEEKRIKNENKQTAIGCSAV